jgi:acyl dehydratase
MSDHDLGRIRFSAADLRQFYRVSADANPVHAGGVVYGMQLLAWIEGQLCTAYHWQQVTALDYRLHRPVMIGQQVVLRASGTGFVVLVAGAVVGRGWAHGA